MDLKNSKFETLHKMLEKQAKLTPVPAFLETLNPPVSPFFKHLTSAASITNHNPLLNSLIEHQARINSHTNYRALRTSVQENRAFLDSLNKHGQLIAELSKPMGLFHSTVLSFINPLGAMTTSVLSSYALSNIKRMANASVEHSVDIEVDISTEAISKVSGEILENTANSNAKDIEDLIRKLDSQIKALKEPKFRYIIANYLYPLILFVLAPYFNDVYDSQVKPYLSTSTKSENKISNFRYVSASTLNVRLAASKKSKVLGNLHYGNVVTIIKKEKNWCLVEWEDSTSGIKITGWVFTRYLKAFK